MVSTIGTRDVLKENFLSCFGDNVRDSIVEYGKTITNISKEYDALIFMARKSVCLLEALKVVGLVGLQGVTISNRVLDFNCEWLRGKKVAIVDDALISGTSIYRIRSRLEEIDCESDVFVLCTNKEWKNRDFVKPEPPFLELTDSECASLCSDIVTAISVIPLPYSTDFPVFSGIRLSSNEISELTSLTIWEISDLTTNIQSELNIFNCTYEPADGINRRLRSTLGTMFDACSLLKIRLYARKFLNDDHAYWCSLIPIVIFKPMLKLQIDSIFEKILVECDDAQGVLSDWCSPTNHTAESLSGAYRAKLQVIQYLVSRKLAELWFETVSPDASSSYLEKHNLEILRYLFPDPIVPAIERVLKNASSRVFEDVGFLAEADLEFTNITSKVAEKNRIDAWSIENKLSSLFLKLYHDYELPAREIVRNHGAEVFDDKKNIFEEYQKYIFRLDKGYSFSNLICSLSGFNIPIDAKNRVVSRFLDLMIDRGVVVPTTCVFDDVVYRGFRHGEDVNFANGERYVLHRLLSDYISEFDSKDLIPGIEVEKLSVIAIKKLLEKKYFCRPDKNVLGQNGTIGIRFSLHGAVVAENCSKIYDAPTESCIRSILCDQDVLEFDGAHSINERGNYRVKDLQAEETAIPEGALEEASTIGSLLGYLRSRAVLKVKDRLTQNDLTLLATITTSRDLCCALAAEVSISSKMFYRIESKLKKGFQVGENQEEFIEYLRDAKRNLFNVALNSAHWKYTSWKKGVVHQKISDIEEGLLQSRMKRDANRWRQYWPMGLLQDPQSKDLPLRWLLDKLCRWIYSARFLYAIVELSARKNSSNPSVNETSSAGQKCLREIAFCDEVLDGSGVCRAGHIEALREQYKTGRFFSVKDGLLALGSINALAQQSEDLLLNTDFAASVYGEPRFIYNYQNVLVITFDPSRYTDTHFVEEFLKTIRALYSDYRKHNNLTEEAIKVIPSSEHEVQESIVIAGYRKKELAFFVSVIDSVMSGARDQNVSFAIFAGLNDSSRLYCQENNSHFFGKIFWQRLENAMRHLRENSLLAMNGELHLLTEKSKNLGSSFNRYAKEYIQNVYRFRQSQATELADPNGLTPPMLLYKLTPSWSYVLGKKMEEQVDIGVLTIIAEEYLAVTDYLKKYPGFKNDVRNAEVSTRRFCLGSLAAKAKSSWHSVAVTRALKQGNESIVSAYNDLVQNYNPKLMVLIGIGGATSEKLDFCDVVVADFIMDYDKRAETPGGPQRTFNPLPPIEPWVKDLYFMLEEKYGEDLSLDSMSSKPYSPTFKVSMGPVLTGGAVVKDSYSEIRTWADVVSRKNLATETEAGGVADAYDNSKLSTPSRAKGYLVLRGISDKADPDKDKKYRHEPAFNAMHVLALLVENASAGFVDEAI